MTRLQLRSRRTAGHQWPQGAKEDVETGLKGGGDGREGSKSQYRQRSRYRNVPPASLGGVRPHPPTSSPLLYETR